MPAVEFIWDWMDYNL